MTGTLDEEAAQGLAARIANCEALQCVVGFDVHDPVWLSTTELSLTPVEAASLDELLYKLHPGEVGLVLSDEVEETTESGRNPSVLAVSVISTGEVIKLHANRIKLIITGQTYSRATH